MPLGDPAGKVAVITGAASGIGRALVEHAAAIGMRVAAVDIAADAVADIIRHDEAFHRAIYRAAGNPELDPVTGEGGDDTGRCDLADRPVRGGPREGADLAGC